MSLTRRLQVLIDDERHERLEREAQRAGVSVGAVVREAIDARVGSPWPSREEAGRRLLDADPTPAEDWEDVKREMEEALAERYER